MTYTTPKQKLFYSLPLIDRIGHLSQELFFLQNLFPIENYEYNIFIPPLSKRPRTNLFLFNKVTQGMNIIETEDEDILMNSYRKKSASPVEEREGELHVLLDGAEIQYEYLKKFQKSPPKFHYKLSADEIYAGLELKNKLGIPAQAPTVTLHVRERGFLPDLNYHSFRDANIENYVPAIEYLLSLGIYIVRIGDPSMKRIEGLPANFIDTPHHPAYNNLIEPYFIATSLFHFGVFSGPCNLTKSFQTPTLFTNTQCSVMECGNSQDLIIPKKFYSYKLNRFLTYEEILFSPLIEFWGSQQFDEVGISLVENSPLELLNGAKEMITRFAGQYGKEDEIRQLEMRVAKINERLHEHRTRTAANPPLYSGHLVYTKFCQSFIEANPWFLGHDFSESSLNK